MSLPENGDNFIRGRRLWTLVLAALLLLPAAACAERPDRTFTALNAGLTTVELPASLDAALPATVPVDIFIPPPGGRWAGDVLVLPGWNFSRREWHSKTTILLLARERGLRMVFPDMLKSLYESRYYPETLMKWGPSPGGRWIREVLIPGMRKYGIFLEGGNNYLLGLSTGARGVALVSLENPGLFRAGAALSGDFDQAAMKRDRLMAAMYGPYDRFPERWTTVDNPLARISEWKMPIYLGHGKKDAVVPYGQTHMFYTVLRDAHPSLPVVLSAPENAAHDFSYWQSELEPAFSFMLSLR
ncbi:MAG TPA: prolyl oligopeptidase family serine peptidase [Spirochaetota bacterium]|nr:prolyl oligopeptidase family serine peptidase [Spirochaetota bacterium]